ncbi:hypothetical protein Q7P37_005111 [Cladosporium fusiforme]
MQTQQETPPNQPQFHQPLFPQDNSMMQQPAPQQPQPTYQPPQAQPGPFLNPQQPPPPPPPQQQQQQPYPLPPPQDDAITPAPIIHQSPYAPQQQQQFAPSGEEPVAARDGSGSRREKRKFAWKDRNLWTDGRSVVGRKGEDGEWMEVRWGCGVM